MGKLNERKKAKDLNPEFLKRIEDVYGPIDVENDFWTNDLTTYYKTADIDSSTGGIESTVIELASFSDSLKKMADAVKSLKQLMGRDEARNDQEIRTVYRELKDVFNKYRTHLRKFYPEQYTQVKNTLEEMSTTGGGAGSASFTGGTGMQYATPYAFRLKGQKPNDKAYKELGYKEVKEGVGASLGPGPKAGSDGVKDNTYVKQFKYKLVPKKIKDSGLEVKQLFQEAQTPKEFQSERIGAFDQIEQQLNDIYKMLSNAKNETIEYYNGNDSSYNVLKPTDLILDYIQDIKKLLKGE